LRFRSIAIDAVKERFLEENIKPIFFYFDYKAQKSQTPTDVAGCLLKQLFYYTKYEFTELEKAYDSQGGRRPDLTLLLSLLKSYSHVRNGSTYVVFDALDECDESYQNDILTLFASLQKSHYKLLISTRPHLQNFSERLTNAKSITIYAHQNDLQNYILHRLTSERSNPKLKAKCLELADQVKGMYVSLYVIFSLLSGFSLPNSNWNTSSASGSQ
jgi:hypothetical protein